MGSVSQCTEARQEAYFHVYLPSGRRSAVEIKSSAGIHTPCRILKREHVLFDYLFVQLKGNACGFTQFEYVPDGSISGKFGADHKVKSMHNASRHDFFAPSVRGG